MQVNRKKNPVTDFTITLHKEYQHGKLSYNACKKQYGGNYERRRNAGSYTYYIRELAVTAEFFRFFKAYFVKVKSKALKGKLFEIVCSDCYGMILHSTNEKLLNDLRQEGVFSEGTRISLIDGYVNQRY